MTSQPSCLSVADALQRFFFRACPVRCGDESATIRGVVRWFSPAKVMVAGLLSRWALRVESPSNQAESKSECRLAGL